MSKEVEQKRFTDLELINKIDRGLNQMRFIYTDRSRVIYANKLLNLIRAELTLRLDDTNLDKNVLGS